MENISSHKENMDSLLIKTREHCKRMLTEADNTKTKCVDGGYKENQEVGAISFPGADLGLSMVLLRLGFTPKDAFGLVHEFALESGRTYNWHSDTHEGHDNCLVGCGHCNMAVEKADQYGVNTRDMRELLNIVMSKEYGVNKVVLDREHKEAGILVVNSSDHSVKPWDEERDVQYFIYDKLRTDDLLNDLSSFLESQGYKIAEDALKDALNEHTNMTLSLLASSKGKPMYNVEIDKDGMVNVVYTGDAPVSH